MRGTKIIMTRLFIYGTLFRPDIQLQVIGREVTSAPGVLRNYAVNNVIINGNHYPIAVPAEYGQIVGGVIEITESEVRLIDDYETKAYERVKVMLADESHAWTYVVPAVR